MLYASSHTLQSTLQAFLIVSYPHQLLPECLHFPVGGLQRSKYKSLKVRAGSTVVIIASFIIVIYLGHVPLMVMILAIQVSRHLLDIHHHA